MSCVPDTMYPDGLFEEENNSWYQQSRQLSLNIFREDSPRVDFHFQWADSYLEFGEANHNMDPVWLALSLFRRGHYQQVSNKPFEA